jgi:hypothetical protein
MTDTLDYIFKRYNLDPFKLSPIEIPNVNRVQLAQLFSKLGYTCGAEIGVAAGIYSEVLCQSNPGLQLYCIDYWEAYEEYHDLPDPIEHAENFMAARERLKDYNTTILSIRSMEAVARFEDNQLDFVYIDANHSWPYVTQDIYYWARKVRPGGIVAGHDYYRPTTWQCDVIGAVNGYTQAFDIKPWFLLGKAYRNPEEVDERARSWFWVQP